MAQNDPNNKRVAALLAAEGLSNIGTQAVRAAADATNIWIAANAASFNTALPEPFKSTATAEQKTKLFMHIAAKRAGL